MKEMCANKKEEVKEKTKANLTARNPSGAMSSTCEIRQK